MVTAETQQMLDRIEMDLRDVAGVRDHLTRKILTAILQRQVEYYRKIAALDKAGNERRKA